MGPRIFFLPLSWPSAAAEGAAKMQDPQEGLTSGEGRRTRARRRRGYDRKEMSPRDPEPSGNGLSPISDFHPSRNYCAVSIAVT